MRQGIDAFYAVTALESCRNGENPRICRIAKGVIQVLCLVGLVANKAVGSLTYHPESLLQGFFKTASYGHHLSHTLHTGPQFSGHSFEFAQVPAGNFADHIVQGRLEEGRSASCDSILEFEKSISEREFCSHEGEGIACGLGCKGGRTAQSGVHLDYPVVISVRAEGILHVTFSHYAYMSHYINGFLAQEMILPIGQSLGWSHDYALSGVDAEGVEIFHIADSDAVVIAVAHHLVFDFLPAFQGFFNQHLRRKVEGFGHCLLQLVFIFAETGAQTSECIGGTHNYREAHHSGCLHRLLGCGSRVGFDGLDPDFVQFLHEKFPVLSLDYGLYRSAEHLHSVFFQNPAAMKFHSAVEGGLSSEC